MWKYSTTTEENTAGKQRSASILTPRHTALSSSKLNLHDLSHPRSRDTTKMVTIIRMARSQGILQTMRTVLHNVSFLGQQDIPQHRYIRFSNHPPDSIMSTSTSNHATIRMIQILPDV